MRRILLSAMAVLAVAIAAAEPAPVLAQAANNNTPLSFGMSADEASKVLGVTLIYVRGRPGNEMFMALPNVKGSALSDRRDGLYLQFRGDNCLANSHKFVSSKEQTVLYTK